MFKDLAPALRTMGWRAIIPLVPREKRPAVEGWEKFNLKPPADAQIEQWRKTFPNGGVGLAYGPDKVVGIDLDWTDRATAETAWRITLDILGPTPLVRIGRAPKRLALYRAEPGLSVSGKAFGGYEVYSRSAQTVLFGVHPDTGAPYRWPEKSPADVSPKDLPLAGRDQLRALVWALMPYRVAPVRKTASGRPAATARRPWSDFNLGIAAEAFKALRAASDQILEAVAILDDTPHGERHHTAVALVLALMEMGRSDQDIREALLPVYLRLTAVEDRVGAGARFANALTWGRRRVGPDDATLLANPVFVRVSKAWDAQGLDP